MSESPTRPEISLPARLVVGALAVLGALAVIQWVIGAFFGIIRFALVLVVVIGVAVLVLWGGPDRDR